MKKVEEKSKSAAGMSSVVWIENDGLFQSYDRGTGNEL